MRSLNPTVREEGRRWEKRANKRERDWRRGSQGVEEGESGIFIVRQFMEVGTFQDNGDPLFHAKNDRRSKEHRSPSRYHHYHPLP